MTKDKSKSVHQLVGNRGSERGLSREDAFTAYVMDRLLYRLWRSRHAKEFYLKGGLLVANLVVPPASRKRGKVSSEQSGRSPCSCSTNLSAWPP